MNARGRLHRWARGSWIRWSSPHQTAPVRGPQAAAAQRMNAVAASVSLPGRAAAQRPAETRTVGGWRRLLRRRFNSAVPQWEAQQRIRAVVASGAELSLGPILGRPGGQGAVYPLTDFPGYVYKRYPIPIRGAAAAFDELIEAGEVVAPELERMGILTVWPLLAFGTADRVDGYAMRLIPKRFRSIQRTPYGRREVESTLVHARPVRPRQTFVPVRPVTGPERVEIVRLVGVFLDTLHRYDLVYGDLSLSNLLYALDPVGLLVMDIDGVHRISAPLVRRKDDVSTPDWFDPHASGQLPLGFDLDRYRYALLVYRMLSASHSPSAAFPADPESLVVPRLDGLDQRQRMSLEFLLRRAATGGQGTRPPITEWLSALAP